MFDKKTEHYNTGDMIIYDYARAAIFWIVLAVTKNKIKVVGSDGKMHEYFFKGSTYLKKIKETIS